MSGPARPHLLLRCNNQAHLHLRHAAACIGGTDCARPSTPPLSLPLAPPFVRATHRAPHLASPHVQTFKRGQIRENLKTSIVAIGVDAVTNAVLAIGNARLYLEQVCVRARMCGGCRACVCACML